MQKINIAFFKQIWWLSKGFWTSEKQWQALLLAAVIIGIQITYVSIMVYYNSWQKDFYNSIQAVDTGLFFYYLKFWPMYMAVFIFFDVNRTYLKQKLEIMWRTWLTDDYVSRWLSNKTYYMMKIKEYESRNDVDNPDQRIAEDVKLFVSYIISLTLGVTNAIMKLTSFGAILWSLSGIWTVHVVGKTVDIPGYMLWIALLYAGLGSWLTLRVGKPLIRLNYHQQELEANFRFGLARLREYYESIAFYHGESREKVDAIHRFYNIRDNFYRLMKKERILSVVTEAHFRLTFLFPYLLGVPRVFTGDMQFGGLMQTANAFSQVEASLAFLVLRYYSNTEASIAQLQTVVARLMDFISQMEEAKNITASAEIQRASCVGNAIQLRELTVERPNRNYLVRNLQLSIEQGNHLLIMGPSGQGKSTLLKTISGIWPYGSGTVEIPQNHRILFLPQKIYLPMGTLGEAILYPHTELSYEGFEKEGVEPQIQEVLRLVGLEHLCEKLNVDATWSQILSLGEQQRLSIAKVLLNPPQWLFLDEATSALDETNEDLMYSLLQSRCPHMTIVSVAHRPRLRQYHVQELRLQGEGTYTLCSC